MAFGSFPVDVLTSMTPLDILLPPEPFEIDFPGMRSSARHFHEDEKEYTLSLALPGVSPADLKLAVEDGMLAISGATKKDAQTYQASHRVRIPSDADPTLAKAVAENGILSITLPRRPKVTHEIAVASSNDGVRKAAEGDYAFSLPFPGVRPSDFKVVCEDSVLSIAVETNTAQQATKTVKRMRLPADADVSAATAAAEYGILTVILPRRTTGSPEEGQNAKSIQLITITNGGAGRESPASST